MDKILELKARLEKVSLIKESMLAANQENIRQGKMLKYLEDDFNLLIPEVKEIIAELDDNESEPFQTFEQWNRWFGNRANHGDGPPVSLKRVWFAALKSYNVKPKKDDI